VSENGPEWRETGPEGRERENGPEGREIGPEGRENGPEGRENGPKGRENDPEGCENSPEGQERVSCPEGQERASCPVGREREARRGSNSSNHTNNKVKRSVKLVKKKTARKRSNTLSGIEDVKANLNTKNKDYKYTGRDPIDILDWSTEYDNVISDLSTDPLTTEMWDEAEAETVSKMTHVTKEGDRFQGIASKKHKLPHEMHDTYIEWLNEVHGIDPIDIPKGRNKTCKPGLRLPKPSGSRWREMIDSKLNKNDRALEARHTRHLIDYALTAALEALKIEDKMSMKDIKKLHKNGMKRKVKQARAVATCQDQPPNTMEEAVNHPTRSFEWVDSAYKEFEGLTDLVVVKHNYTREMLKEAGVKFDPINISTNFTHKYTDGILSRLKTRMALAGHSGNLKKEVHFDKTFATSPNQHTMRLMQAILVSKQYYRLSFDIIQAYCHSELESNELIGVKYPKGFERYDENGTELYMLLVKNLYGHPQASRNWSRTRDKFILETFNKDGWTCHRCLMDPCLFRFTKSDKTAIGLIYTDDVDIISDSTDMMEEIYKICNDKWGCKKVDGDFILGVKRVLSEDRSEVNLTMTAFIDGMVESFKDYLPTKRIGTPFPESVYLCKDKSISDDESFRLLMMKEAIRG